MTAWLVMTGTFFIAGAPSLALIFCVLVPQSHLLILSILGAFMWSLAMMLSGIIYLAIPPLRNTPAWSVFVAVTMQEAMRFALHAIFRTMARAGDGIDAFLRPGVHNELKSGMAIGVGFAFLSAMVNFFSPVIDEFRSNTAIYIPNCPVNFVVAAAVYALAFSLMHIALGVLVWPAYSEDPSWLKMLIGYALHLATAFATLGNETIHCRATFGIVYALVAGIVVLTALQSNQRVKKETE